MRYFEDGDLTIGLKIANKPYPADQIEGDWHIVWACIDGSTRTTNYDEPAALSLMGLRLRQVEPSDKRKKMVSGHIRAELSFCQWGLEYEGIYNTEGPATKLELKANTTPRRVDADDEAFLLFGAVLDDQGFPFLQFCTAASPREARLDHLQNIEFVAKKTDPTGIHCLELTKNEKLRLGYPVRSDGTFEEEEGSTSSNIREESYESLTRQLHEHTEAQAKIIERLKSIRTKMDEQLRNVGQRVFSMTPQSSGAGATTTTTTTTTANNTSSATAAKRSVPGRKDHHRLSTSAMVNALLGTTTSLLETTTASANGTNGNTITAATTTDPLSHPSTSTSGTPSSGDSATESTKYKKKVCRACNTSVSIQNWAVHEKTNKHKHNVSGEVTPGRGSAKRRKVLNGPVEREGRLARPGPRRAGDMSLRGVVGMANGSGGVGGGGNAGAGAGAGAAGGVGGVVGAEPNTPSWKGDIPTIVFM